MRINQELWWPIGVVTALGISIALNVTLFILAHDSSARLVDPTPYESGMRYQGTIDAHSRFSISQYSLTFTSTKSEHENTYLLTAVLTDSHSVGMDGFRVVLDVLRPSNSSFDQKLEMIPVVGQRGSYITTLVGPSGLWLIKALLVRDGVRYKTERSLVLY